MKLKKIEVNAFAGIHPEAPVVIEFPSKFVIAKGDNGTGKSSLLNALLVACGQISKDSNEKAFVNNETGKIDMNFSFVGKDRLNYDVRVTKSTFTLLYEGESVPEPITKMKELLGVIGVSPMEIKMKPLKEIVKWLSSYSNKSAEEFEAQLLKHKNGLKEARDARAMANKQYKALAETLDNEEMFSNWEASEKRYSSDVDVAKLSKELDEAGKLSDKYILFEDRMKQKRADLLTVQDRITQLKEELKKAELSKAAYEEQIGSGEQWLIDNLQGKKKYDEVKRKYDTAAQDKANFNKWQEIKRKKLEKDEFETLSQKADGKEKQILQSLKELQAEILPDIKGVELVTEDQYDNNVLKKEGLYWNGRNAAQMSETEFWSLVMQIWRKYKVKIVVIDNMQSLGSAGVELLQKLAADGAYILAAEMNRKKKTLEINYL